MFICQMLGCLNFLNFSCKKILDQYLKDNYLCVCQAQLTRTHTHARAHSAYATNRIASHCDWVVIQVEAGGGGKMKQKWQEHLFSFI